jgi:pimeloyl-ACP methyl ester carboxylesterase
MSASPTLHREGANAPVEITLLGDDGVELAVAAHGDVGAPALVFAHGFGQTRLAWTASAERFAVAGYRCVVADARGHGDSGWRPDGNYALDQFATDLVQIARYAGPNAVLVGASFGGLVGLLAQADLGPLFRALVLVDVTPRWEAAGVERILAFMRAHPDGFATLAEASQAIADYLPHRRETRSPERLRALLVRRDDGRYRWHWDPHLLDAIAEGFERHQERLLAAAARITVPTLLLSGSESDVVSQSTINEFLTIVPHARHVVVPRATHMVAGDRNEAFTDAVMSFVRTLGAVREAHR